MLVLRLRYYNTTKALYSVFYALCTCVHWFAYSILNPSYSTAALRYVQ